MAREIAEDLATTLVVVRKANRRRYEIESKRYASGPGGSARPAQAVAGGIVRSYKFTYEEGKEIAQGSMQIMFSKDRFCECAVTVVILKDFEANGGITGERIVHNTRKLSDFNESVLEAYFSGYCDKINKWIVVYEKFESYFDRENESAIPRLCEDPEGLELTDFWRQKLRSLVTVLAASAKKHVIHAGLSLATGYAISGGTIKLVNVARCVQKGSTDLEDMRQFMGTNKYLKAYSCADWPGFDFLLRSRKMNHSDWDAAVLGHPILLEASTSGKLNAYEGVEIFMWGCPAKKRAKFAAALHLAMPEHVDRHIFTYFPKNDPDAIELKQKSAPHPNIYLCIIQTVRNLSNHQKILDGLGKCLLIHSRFRGYMSMAYSISKMPANEWDDMESPAYLTRLKSRA